MAFVVVYDACVLYPNTLRDLLIRVGQARIMQAKWTEQILDEVDRAPAGHLAVGVDVVAEIGRPGGKPPGQGHIRQYSWCPASCSRLAKSCHSCSYSRGRCAGLRRCREGAAEQ